MLASGFLAGIDQPGALIESLKSRPGQRLGTVVCQRHDARIVVVFDIAHLDVILRVNAILQAQQIQIDTWVKFSVQAV